MIEMLKWLGVVVAAVTVYAALVWFTLRVLGVRTRAELQAGLDPYEPDPVLDRGDGLYVRGWMKRPRTSAAVDASSDYVEVRRATR